MSELTRTEKWLEKAFQLAYFIHGDVSTAKQIAFNAMNKLEVASNAQYKRTYYTPESKKSRNKVSMSDLQLLQRLVYVESEPFEKEKEFTEAVSEQDLLVYFVKHLIRITLKRNSFYVTLGLSRILHNYGTNEAMEIYNVIVQNPDRVHDDYYYRSRKGVLMKELKNRFGEKLEITSVNRGEQRFQTNTFSPLKAELIKNCLHSFIPWNTNCSLPEKFNPYLEVIDSFVFNGKNADDEHRIELNRMHAVLNPETFQKVVNSLSFPLPLEKLEIPKFNMKNQNPDSAGNGSSKNFPKLERHEITELQNLLEEESARRKSATCGLFRVLVDGKQTAFFDSRRQKKTKFEFSSDSAELIEIYAVEKGRDILMTTYLLGGEDLLEKTSILLENGQKFTFNFADSTCEINFQETILKRKIKCFVFSLSQVKENYFKALSLSFASLSVVCLGILWLAVGNFSNNNAEIVEHREKDYLSVSPIETIAENPLKNEEKVQRKIVTAKNEKVFGEKTAEKDKESKPKNEIEPATEAESKSSRKPENVTAEKPSATEKLSLSPLANTTRSIFKSSGKSLKDIKFLYLEVSGDEPNARSLNEQLTAQFKTDGRFITVNNKEKADGLLKISVKTQKPVAQEKLSKLTVSVRLINADGLSVLPDKKHSAWKYQGQPTEISKQIVKALNFQK